MKNTKPNCYFQTVTKPKIGDIVQTCRDGQGVITSLQDNDTTFTFINTKDGNVYTGNLTSDSDLIERPKVLTEVIFRRCQGQGTSNDVIALFPALAADTNANHCLSYMKVGQHGAASVSFIRDTVPAKLTDKDVSDLFIELTNAGYYLKVVSRFTSNHTISRQKAIG
jgi:hypothetical protein